jgi:hypothetical protein
VRGANRAKGLRVSGREAGGEDALPHKLRWRGRVLRKGQGRQGEQRGKEDLGDHF